MSNEPPGDASTAAPQSAQGTMSASQAWSSDLMSRGPFRQICKQRKVRGVEGENQRQSSSTEAVVVVLKA